jgi:hypothetical protein
MDRREGGADDLPGPARAPRHEGEERLALRVVGPFVQNDERLSASLVDGAGQLTATPKLRPVSGTWPKLPSSMCQFQFPSHFPVVGSPLKLQGQP